MEPWIPITIAAALAQTWRTAMQQKLRGLLSVNGAGFVRFIYGVPVAFLLLMAGLYVTGLPLPYPTPYFLLWAALGGLCQIVATNLLIMSFGFRGFAVGTAYAKTEAAQSAIFALIVLGEVLHLISWVGIGFGLVGVMTLSLAGRGLRPGEFLAATVQPAALCGLSAGFIFAFTAIFIKLAIQALDGESLVVRALFGLVVTNTMQTVMAGGYLLLREPQEFRKALTSWRSSMWVGTLSAIGSACWYTAFALAPVALVRSVGQIELVFTLLFGRFYLHEPMKKMDVLGLVLIVGGVVLIVLGR